MRRRSWRISAVCFALLLLVVIGGVGLDSYLRKSAHAANQSVTRTVNDPITTTVVLDAEGDTVAGTLERTVDFGGVAPFPFAIKGSITYTLDVPVAWHPPLTTESLVEPVIRNIKQDVYVVGGNTPNLPFGFQVSSSVEVYSGDGKTLLTTISGNLDNTIHASNDIDYALQDFTTTPTTTPYQPYPSDFVGPRTTTTLFVLKHIVHVVADSGYQINFKPVSPFTYKVDSPES